MDSEDPMKYFDRIDEGNFTANEKLVMQSVLAALNYLHELSRESGVPLQDITGDMIIDHILAARANADK